MKIVSINVMRIAIPFDAQRRAPKQKETTFNAASPSLRRMETLLIKISTDNGLCGWGEAFGHLANPVTEQALCTLVAPLFIGKALPDSPQAIAELMQQEEQALHAFGARCATRSPRWISRCGTRWGSASSNRSGSCSAPCSSALNATPA
ncbi:mandelate racemase|nr:mandelate racemase [Candidatus Pantoea persica]